MPKMSAKETALVIDANALIHRAWHALPPLTAPDGRVVNAVYGFASVLMKIVAQERPTYLAVAWDTPEPTYRHTAREEYKAHRVELPDEFYDQFPLVKEIVEAFGGCNLELPGYEADDILATLAVELAKKDTEVTLLTSDRDVWQLIAPRVRVMAFKKGVSETVIYTHENLEELTGLKPTQIAEFKALRGDPSDNLKGVPGIGDKTATDLLQVYGTLERIFKAAHDPKSDLTPSVRRKLVEGEAEARAILPIVTLVADAPLKQEIEETCRRPVDEEAVRRLFTMLGFKSLLARALGRSDEKKEPKTEERASARSVQIKKPFETRLEVAPGLADLLKDAREGQRLVVRPIEQPQGSLFGGGPTAALASSRYVYMLSAADLEKAKVREMFDEALADEGLKKIGHNLKAAWHWARARGFELRSMSFDTEIAAYLLAAGNGDYDLDTLAANRLGIFFTDGDDRPLHEAAAIRALATDLETELREQKLDHVMSRFETPLLPVLAEMEAEGILIDIPYFKALTDDFRREKARLEREMEKLAGESFNPGSPQQLAHVLFNVLGLSSKGIKRGKTGISTAASELEKLEGAHPIVEKISEYREVAKLLSTYVEALPALADREGRVHTTFKQTVAATGRLSSINPNLQNIPIRTESGRKIRRGFIARKGYRLLSCDYSQIELRVVAALAKDEKMLDAFRRGIDIHTATAAAIWKVPLDAVTRDQRRAAKAINFGIIYGQGPVGLSKAAGISFEEAKRFIKEYFAVYSGVRAYLDETKELARTRGYVETLFGRRRPIPDINSSRPEIRAAAERMAINMPVQGTATGDLVKLALIAMHRELPKISSKTRILLQVHDEIVFEVPEKEIERVAPAVVDIMQNVEKIGVPIVVDAKQGENWDQMEKTE